jgi:hypothetical protein
MLLEGDDDDDVENNAYLEAIHGGLSSFSLVRDHTTDDSPEDSGG